ncbi:MAG: DsrE family protein [Deltaproteobacteria bacterium]|nr:DsrE family protein [Deltaproteobacteria bacterium]
MKIAILLKNGPCTDEADRALQTAADMLVQGHTVSLYLLQEAVRFCGPAMKCSSSMGLQGLIEKNLKVHVLTRDAELRGINAPSADQAILEGSYESLVDLMASCDRVVGIL